MLFSDKVREDLEREVLGKGFQDYFGEAMRGDPALAAFATPADFVTFERDAAGRASERHAVAVAHRPRRAPQRRAVPAAPRSR